MSVSAIRTTWRICSRKLRLPVSRLSSTSHHSLRLTSTTAIPSDEISSGRSAFKETPVDQSIFKYIQSVGVGKAKRTKRRKHRRKTKDEARFFTKSEEQEQFISRRRLPSTTPPPPFPCPKGIESTESGNSVRRFPVKLIASVGGIDQKFPRTCTKLPEVAIAGRSNVGKSTLLNALLHGTRTNDEEESDEHRFRRPGRPRPTSRTAKLPVGIKATTSAKPGETRAISFYQLSAKLDQTKISLLLVDLPGYGFAFASEEKAEEWQSLMKSYIVGRGKALKRILLLIDSRHGMKKADLDFLGSMQQSLFADRVDNEALANKKKRELPPIQLVLTKCDLVSQADLARRVTLVRQQLSDSLQRQPSALPIMLVSAQMEGQAGVLELQKELAALVMHGVR